MFFDSGDVGLPLTDFFAGFLAPAYTPHLNIFSLFHTLRLRLPSSCFR